MGTQHQSRANDICAHCREKGHWKRDCPNLSSDQGMFVVKVLQRSRKLSKDEVVLRLGDGKAVAVEAVGIINLVVSDRVRLELKDCYFVPSMIKNIISIPLLDNVGFEFLINKNCFYLIKDGSSHLLGHISRMKGLVDLKSLEIDNLDNLPACESCLKGKMTRKPLLDKLNGVAERRNRTLLDMIRSMMSFTVLPLSFWGYGLETVARLLKIASSKTVAQMPYQIWHDKLASYKYLRVWGSPAYVKRLVGDKLDLRSSLCRFIGYPKENAGYYFYDPSEQKVFISRNAVFLDRGFPTDTRRDELLYEESSEAPQLNAGTSSAPTISTDNVPILRR
ncbi:UNVERIFIED_CONTAM: hypothetical protein Sradi_1321400 [Sesamum radiatum]|uniref:CCHC-type domain-containing protein n=1 Tax=Sesamum radiatum TaxID=300843 RepID=A0AAW2UP15_SESRA